MEIYTYFCFQSSQLITRRYSTSFYTASRLFPKNIQQAIFSIYGFVRLADEIVDSFHHVDQHLALISLEQELDRSLKQGISLNPIIESFRQTVVRYSISQAHIDAFIKSMHMDLSKTHYQTNRELNEYIYGSADVVGLMCLTVFCNQDQALYIELEQYARKLGSAFQKINFLRDLHYDMYRLNRCYFPASRQILENQETFDQIIEEINLEFDEASVGIRQLPREVRLAVYTAYQYYRTLTKKIARQNYKTIQSKRVRINHIHKLFLFASSALKNSLGTI